MAHRRGRFFKKNHFLVYTFFWFLLILLIFNNISLFAVTFKIASYNVENLFDLKDDGREYPEYIPNTGFRWDNITYKKKINNIAKVLCDLDADIVGLQEVESETALNDLIYTIKSNHCKDYGHYAIVKDKKTIPIRSAIISTFPIVKKKDIKLPGDFRDILKVDIEINGKVLTIFVNHWKSKRWPENFRIIYARKIMEEIKKLNINSDYILLGDFNANYDEFRYIKFNKRLNNTKGLTGINHILKTVSRNNLIDKFTILENLSKGYHYNLWLEIDKFERFSYIFRNRKETPDNIIISSSLFDKKNISYLDASFGVFKPLYLFNNDKINSWKRAKSGKAWHTGEGYSDHLPIYAYFTDVPFKIKDDYPASLNKTISELYKNNNTPAIIRNAALIYKYKNNCIIKRENDRAIYCYKCLDNFQILDIYDLYIHKLKKFKGLIEITSANIINKKGKIKNLDSFYITCNENTDFAKSINEICKEIEGIYNNEYLHLGKQKIKLTINKNIKIPNNKKLTLSRVRIGFLKEPTIIVEDSKEINYEN
jgi:endonuclease/exonuclease/phosphatase family metal-dependent hydrolase